MPQVTQHRLINQMSDSKPQLTVEVTSQPGCLDHHQYPSIITTNVNVVESCTIAKCAAPYSFSPQGAAPHPRDFDRELHAQCSATKLVRRRSAIYISQLVLWLSNNPRDLSLDRVDTKTENIKSMALVFIPGLHSSHGAINFARHDIIIGMAL